MDWHGLTRIGTDWPRSANWRICVGTKNWLPIGTGLAQDWHGLARIDTDWPRLVNWRICVGTKNWPPIGTGLAWIGMDWHGLAQDMPIGDQLRS